MEHKNFAVAENAHPLAGQNVVILGAGLAGLGAAYQLVRKGITGVTVVEEQEQVGGICGSFEFDGVYCDFGSHRLFPMLPDEIMRDLRRMLGEDLIYQVRHGRILLQKRWIHFPLKPFDLISRLPKSFIAGVLADKVRTVLARDHSRSGTFSSVLECGLGRTMCRSFYFPYARKIWGVEPDDLSVMAAQRRVSGSSVGKILRKIASQLPGFKPSGTGHFYYPRHGYGQIAECLYKEARKLGAEFKLGSRFIGIDRDGGRITAMRYQMGGQAFVMPTKCVWSTIPINLLLQGMRPEPPGDILEAASNIRYRGMILIYLLLDQDRFGTSDAYYFPEEIIPISRLSEPKNFSRATEPHGKTVLCAELPSDPESPEWGMSDEQLGGSLCDWLARVGLPVRARVSKVTTRRLRQAYPVYLRNYEECFFKMDQWLGGIDGVLTFGRQGLFAHDNTHHVLPVAYAAVACLSRDGKFDRVRWAEYRKEFQKHVVED